MENFQALQSFMEFKDSDLHTAHYNLFKILKGLQTEGFTPQWETEIQSLITSLENIQGDITVIAGHMDMDGDIPPSNITDNYLISHIKSI